MFNDTNIRIVLMILMDTNLYYLYHSHAFVYLYRALCEPDYEADNDRENCEYVGDGYADVHRCLNRAGGFRIASDCLKCFRNQNTEADAGADNSEPYDYRHAQYFCYFNVHFILANSH